MKNTLNGSAVKKAVISPFFLFVIPVTKPDINDATAINTKEIQDIYLMFISVELQIIHKSENTAVYIIKFSTIVLIISICNCLLFLLFFVGIQIPLSRSILMSMKGVRFLLRISQDSFCLLLLSFLTLLFQQQP